MVVKKGDQDIMLEGPTVVLSSNLDLGEVNWKGGGHCKRLPYERESARGVVQFNHAATELGLSQSG